MHAFSYSPRPGTAAEALGDRVAPEEKKRRSQVLRGLSEVRSRHRRLQKLGGRERVLVDKVARHAVLRVHPRLHALLPAGGRDASAGEVVEVSVQELHADGLRVTPGR